MISFEELFNTYAADVYRFAYLLAGDSDEAKDITSETFVRAWAKSERIRTETLKAYLLTIARNIYLESRRKGRQRAAFEHSAERAAVVASLLEIMRAGRAGTFEQHELQWRVLDREVRVAGLRLGRLGPEHLAVELDRLVEVVDVEGKLQTHGWTPLWFVGAVSTPPR